MTAFWKLLCGDVPGGFSVPLVAAVAFLLVWEYVYRAGQTLPRRTYLRWRWLAPVLILFIYVLVWIQSPPKLEPTRIAVVVDESTNDSQWEIEALADLTARSLKETLPDAIVNPWADAVNYDRPAVEVLQRAGYRVYTIMSDSLRGAIPRSFTLSRWGGKEQSFSPKQGETLLILSSKFGNWILEDMGKRDQLLDPFSRTMSPDVLEKYYQDRWDLAVSGSDAARTFLLQALREDSTFTPAKILLARSLELAGARDDAQSWLLDAVRSDTSSSEALLALGEFYLRGYQWEGAEAALEVLLTRDPTRVRVYFGLSKIHPERLKDLRLNSPEALLEEAVRLDPAFGMARLALANVLLEQGMPLKARGLLLNGLDINPTSEALLLKLGVVEIYSGRPDAARDVYQKILKEDSQNAIALFNLGVVDYRTKKYDRAIDHFRQSIGFGGPVDNYYYLGLIYQIKGDQGKAKFYYQKRWELRTGEDDAFGLKARDLAATLQGVAGG